MTVIMFEKYLFKFSKKKSNLVKISEKSEIYSESLTISNLIKIFEKYFYRFHTNFEQFPKIQI